MSRPADLVDELFAETPTVEVTAERPALPGPAARRGTPTRHEPLARPLSPHAGDGARPAAAPDPRRARRRRRAALIAGAGVLLAAVVGLAATATAVPNGESWGAELAVSGGDDVNVRLADGAVRLVAPSTSRGRSEGVMVLAPRRPAAPANAITTDLTADLPPGTSARVDVRGVLPTGAWSRWLPTRDGVRTVLPSTTTQVQARIVLLGGADAVSPAVQRLWLTTSRTTTAQPPVTGTTAIAPPAPKPVGPKPTAPKPPPRPAGPGMLLPIRPVGPKPAGPKPSAPKPVASTPTASKPTQAASSAPTTTPAAPTVPTTAPAAAPPAGPPAHAPAAQIGLPGLGGLSLLGAPDGPAPKAMWDADITRQSLGMFKDTPWDVVGAERPAVVAATDLPGRRALRFTLPAGAGRAEVEPTVENLTEGQDRYVRLSVRLAPGFPVDADPGQTITRFAHEGPGAAPLELRVAHGAYVLSGGPDRPGGAGAFDKIVAPAVTGAVTTLVLHVRFSSTSATSVVDAWADGRQQIAGFHPPAGTLRPGTYGYWTIGLDRDRRVETPATYELSDARLGDSYAAVAG